MIRKIPAFLYLASRSLATVVVLTRLKEQSHRSLLDVACHDWRIEYWRTKIPNFPPVGRGVWGDLLDSLCCYAGSLERGWLHRRANHSRVVETWRSNHHLAVSGSKAGGWLGTLGELTTTRYQRIGEQGS